MSLIRLTDRKLAANRGNAQKSTGPRTTEGKAASAENNAVHVIASIHDAPVVLDSSPLGIPLVR
ncbi:MAG TPA: hypothetical protein VGK29_02610 [Paludibaculum sp.]|jgi:hypothetical protein